MGGGAGLGLGVGIILCVRCFGEGEGRGLGVGLIFSRRVFCYNLWCEGVLGWGILVGGKGQG